ncbi:hypothetical protein PABG_04111 [Paracoccidioides brasiliensis Pb03]|nr:hypothetical protein PABG_04111 [Paracoccidioides brasiliensis Pb03]
MADSGDRNGPSANNKPDRPRRPEEENPFIAFCRYADEHFASLLQSFIGLPSTISPPTSRNWLYFQGRDPARMFHHQRLQAPEVKADNQDTQCNGQWNKSETCSCGRDDSKRTPHRSQDGSQGAAGHPTVPFDHWLLTGRRYFEHEFPSSIFESPLDSLWPFEPFHLFPLLRRSSSPFSIDLLTSSNSPGWPIQYLLFSPYSPLHLERQQNIGQKPHENLLSSLFSSLVPSHNTHESETPHWREAFEDLLRIENGKDMLNGDARAVIRKETPKDWISGIIDRGSLGNRWSHVRKGPNDYFNYRYNRSYDGSTSNNMEISHPEPINESDDREHDMREDKWLTELDLYEKFLNRVNEPSDEGTVPFVSPLMGMIIEDLLRQRKKLLEQQSRWEREMKNEAHYSQFKDCQKDLDQPEKMTHPESETETNMPVSMPQAQSSPYVISTMTTTERKTLPDGSVQTTITRKRRFSDENEETSETVHIENANQTVAEGEQTSQNRKQEPLEVANRQKRGGWFWKG